MKKQDDLGVAPSEQGAGPMLQVLAEDGSGLSANVPNADIYTVVSYSGGITSWAAASLVWNKNTQLLFADTIIEDEDVYRFLIEGAAILHGASTLSVADLSARCWALPPPFGDTLRARKDELRSISAEAMRRFPQLTWIAEGRTPWEVFNDERFLGNSRIDPCSKILKRKLLDKWKRDNCAPMTTIVVGITYTEIARLERLQEITRGKWHYVSPLCRQPLRSKRDCMDMANAVGLIPPRLYHMGFPHANCGGFCVKAGQGAFALLHDKMPDRYAQHEAEEEAIRITLGDVSIMKDRRTGASSRLTMRDFRERKEKVGTMDFDADLGGCGCALPSEDENDPIEASCVTDRSGSPQPKARTTSVEPDGNSDCRDAQEKEVTP